ncbi:MAG TPA: Sir2 family NAD-dependent protein deacetylase [Deltaproteobacteria bacterium]|nr:Sir2 family NAD-dependent protein deacetylase [Deltaproteobacteria bacterium]HPJ93956.1 Sir2 family NAD-dependent protein deacetylase [Deltaproteobacteria bacterium]HPR51343.1 Sir2 family NAD-dependent protein deacetylase [Deltaproteobacteria bacterium]
MNSYSEGTELIAGRILAGGKNVFFTGAGISTESGIPDYRSQGGLWEQFRPVYFDEFMSSRAARIEYWRRKAAMYNDLKDARPNPGHTALAALHEMGLIEAVITQNVDGLHQASGFPDEMLVELHGNSLRVRCMECGKLSGLRDAIRRIESGDVAPECECGGYLKPDTISFGQAMPEKEVERAMQLSREAETFVVVGSTLVVQPAAHMPVYAKQNGAFVAIINLSETPLDDMCDVIVREKAGTALQGILEEVRLKV